MARFPPRRQVLAWSAALPLAGCARRTEPSAGGIVTITWYASSMTSSHTDPRQSLIDAFQKAHPRIRVKLVSAPTSTDEDQEQLRYAIPRDLGPDVYLGDVVWPADFAKERLALALDDHLPEDFWDRFDPELVAAARSRNRTYAVPFYVNQAVLLYRRDLVPTPPDTWEELAAQADGLVTAGRVKHGFVWQGDRYEGLTCVWTEFSRDAGAEDGLRISTEPSVAALTFMRSLLTSGASPAAVTGFREPQALQSFEAGEAAFLRSWDSAYLSLAQTAAAGTLGVASLPSFAGRVRPGASTIGGWSLYVNPRTRHLPEVLTFLRWMTGVPAQYTIAQYSIIPTNEIVRADPLVGDSPGIKASVQARPVSRPSGRTGYLDLSTVIFTAVHRALTGEAEPRAALTEAQRTIDRLTG
ncbi:extracellular solute-binding protein [Actinocorallia longicatena]|uniref:extracellular solute-binding protein n=1 Tax=Actinocorallia longicatena TaxID=111803 RepID=UPI0031DAC136